MLAEQEILQMMLRSSIRCSCSSKLHCEAIGTVGRGVGKPLGGLGWRNLSNGFPVSKAPPLHYGGGGKALGRLRRGIGKHCEGV